MATSMRSSLISFAGLICTCCLLAPDYVMGEFPDGLRVTKGFETSIPVTPSYRGGSMVALDGGRILLGYGQAREMRGVPPGTVRIDGVVSTDGGKTWGEKRLLEHNPECQTGRPSFLRTAHGSVWMFYYGFVKLAERASDSQSDLWVVQSNDQGKSWTHRQKIFEGFTGATNGAIQTKSGKMIVPFSYMVDPMRLVSACVVSADQGKTWKRSQAIDLGKLGGYGDHAGALEPSVVELLDDRIWMLIRTNRGEFYQAFSTDEGLTWSEPTPTSIFSPNAPGFVTRLSSGRLALLWNLIDAEQAARWRSGQKPTNQRNRLAIALSENDGKTWSRPVICAEAKEISYPFLLEPSPGQLLISSGRLRAPELEMDSVVLGIAENALLNLVKSTNRNSADPLGGGREH